MTVMHKVKPQAWHASRRSGSERSGEKPGRARGSELIEEGTPAAVTGWLRVLAMLLTVWEPVSFAAAAAGSFNAIAVRGVPVVLVLILRLCATAACVAAGRALLDRRPSAPSLARIALAVSLAAKVFAAVTPFFPSNRLPGETTVYVVGTVTYYGVWLAYLMVSKHVAALGS